MYRDAFLAVRIRSSVLSFSVNATKTGIAANGFTTEKSELKLANNSAPMLKKKLEISIFSEIISNMAQRYAAVLPI